MTKLLKSHSLLPSGLASFYQTAEETGPTSPQSRGQILAMSPPHAAVTGDSRTTPDHGDSPQPPDLPSQTLAGDSSLLPERPCGLEGIESARPAGKTGRRRDDSARSDLSDEIASGDERRRVDATEHRADGAGAVR